MKIKILIGFAIAILSALTYLYFEEYGVHEITPDNYQEKLQVVYSVSVFRGNNTVFLDDPSILINANTGETNNLYRFNKYSATADVVEINDNRIKDFWYTVLYDKSTKMPYHYGITEWKVNENPYYLPQIIKLLMEKGGFTLKRTELIKGHDILIKDVGDYFLIAMILDNVEHATNLSFEVYSKRKYFKQIHK